MVCFLAFLLESALRRRLVEAGIKLKYVKLIDYLKQLLAVQVRTEGVTYLARTESTGSACDVFKVLGIRPSKHLQLMP